MRTYGRITQPDGSLKWVVIETAPDGNNDVVWLTTLIQNLKLNLGESPFYANAGIPAHNSLVQQIAPDYYVSRVQAQFSGYFASLIVAKDDAARDPTYRINVTLNNGVKIIGKIPT